MKTKLQHYFGTAFKLLLIYHLSFIIYNCEAQNVGINGTGATAHASALLDLDDAGSNNKGLLIPRIPLTAINAAAPVTSPATSLLVYNTASASTGTNAVSPGYYYWDGAKWVRFAYSASGSSAFDWNILGNTGTNPTTNFLGTIDNQDLVFRTNNVFVAKFRNNGTFTNSLLNQNILDGIGTGGNPGSLLWEFNNGGYAMGIANQSNLAQANGLVIKTVSTASNTSILDLSTGTQTLAGTPVMSVKGNGNVGIGTTTPDAALTIRFSNTLSQLSGNTNNAGLHMYMLSNADGYVDAITNSSFTSNLHLRTYNNGIYNEGVYISNNGNVGIGTTTPARVLEVQGNASIGNANTTSIDFLMTRTNAGAKTDIHHYVSVNNSPTINYAEGAIYSAENIGNVTTPFSTKPYFEYYNLANANSLKHFGFINKVSGTFNLADHIASISLSQNGNVGIGTGTAIPVEKLEIFQGSEQITGTNGGEGVIFKSSSATGSKSGLYFKDAVNNEFFRMIFDRSANNTNDLSFWSNSNLTPVLNMLQNGNIGINVINPAFKLHVNGSIIKNEGTSNTVTNVNGMLLGLNNGAITGFVGDASSTDNDMQLYSYNDNIRIGVGIPGSAAQTVYFNQAGNLGVGNVAPAFKLDVAGTTACTGNVWTSDKRKKQNIQPLTLSAIETIKKLNPVSYEWREVLDDGMKGIQMGFIAQELEEVLPSMVVTANNEEKSKAVKYNELLPIYAKAIQEQQELIEKLNAQNESLTKRIEALEKK